MPARTSSTAVQRFVERHRAWIERKRQEARDRAIPQTPFPPHRIEFAACAETWRVHLSGTGRRVRARPLADGLLVLSGEASDTRAVRTALRRWLMKRAAEHLGPVLQQCADELGFTYSTMKVRRQRTRWGSCSTRGTISLNCCLLFQRPEVVRYLLIHELAHTLHLNHSRRFWQTVARHCGEYRSLDRELLDGWRRVPAWVFAEDQP